MESAHRNASFASFVEGSKCKIYPGGLMMHMRMGLTEIHGRRRRRERGVDACEKYGSHGGHSAIALGPNLPVLTAVLQVLQ